jgi:hypothetical protein
MVIGPHFPRPFSSSRFRKGSAWAWRSVTCLPEQFFFLVRYLCTRFDTRLNGLIPDSAPWSLLSACNVFLFCLMDTGYHDSPFMAVSLASAWLSRYLVSIFLDIRNRNRTRR